MSLSIFAIYESRSYFFVSFGLLSGYVEISIKKKEYFIVTLESL